MLGQKERQVKMKKVISLLVSLVMAVSSLSAGAYAKVNRTGSGTAMPMYESGDTFSSSLSLKDGTATCKTSFILDYSEKWISIKQTLEKKSPSWTSTGDTWSITASKDSNYYIFSNAKSLSTAGEYRLKSEIVIKNSGGKQETITRYSDPITVK